MYGFTPGWRRVLFYLVLFVFVSVYNCQGDRFSLYVNNFDAQWPQANPSFAVHVFPPNGTEQLRIAGFHFSKIQEIHYSYNPANNAVEDQVVANGVVVQTISFDSTLDDFSITTNEDRNAFGVQFNKTINATSVAIKFSTNYDSDISMEIPRTADNQDCSSTYTAYPNCSCDQEYIFKKNSTVKVAINVTNWSWEPLSSGKTNKILQFTLDIDGPLNVAYYLSKGINTNNFKSLFNNSICDVPQVELNMSTEAGIAIVPVSLFTSCESDNEMKPMYFTVNRPQILATGVSLGLRLMFDEFNNSLYYDPDISVLFGGGRKDGAGGSGDQEDEPVKDSTEADQDKIVIIIPVVIGGVLIIVVVMAVILVIVLAKRRRDLARVFDRSRSTVL